MKQIKIEAPDEHNHLLEDLPPTAKQIILEALTSEPTPENIQSFLNTELAFEYEDIFEILFATKEMNPLLKDTLTRYEQQKITLGKGLEDAIKLKEKRVNSWEYEGNEIYETETINSIKALESAKHHPELFLGKGNAAFVFSVPEVPEICIKFLHTPDHQIFSIEREFNILDTVNSIQLSTIKIPEAHAVAKNINGEKAFFTMKTISGHTLLEIIEHPSKRKALLEKMGVSEKDFVEKLLNETTHTNIAKDLKKLHQEGVIHGDIHPRNIMINTQGELYLIDFGNAILPATLNQTSDAMNENIENIKENDISGFLNSLKSTAIQIRQNIP
jgi:tRNA A-37 threonylcarbamoyl transferase component Bud32